MTEKYYNEEGKISTEENAVVKLEEKDKTVKAFKREGLYWKNQWTAKNVELGDVKIVKGGSSSEVLKKKLKKEMTK